MLAAGRPRKSTDIGLVVAPFGDSGLGLVEAGKEQMRPTGSAENNSAFVAVSNPEQSVSVFDLSWSFGEYRGGKQPFHAKPSPLLIDSEQVGSVPETGFAGKSLHTLIFPWVAA